MNYIEEELLRQRRVWAALLLGKQEAGQESERGRQELRQTMPETKSGVQRADGEANRDLRVDPQERQTVRSKEGVQTEVEHSMRIPVFETPAERNRRERTGGRDEAVTVNERTELTVLQIGTGEEQDAKRLSRIYQRDARRYDGGFSLY